MTDAQVVHRAKQLGTFTAVITQGVIDGVVDPGVAKKVFRKLDKALKAAEDGGNEWDEIRREVCDLLGFPDQQYTSLAKRLRRPAT